MPVSDQQRRPHATPYGAPPMGRSSSTTLGDIHACLQEISSRLELLLPRDSLQPEQPAASVARASASSLVLRSAHLTAQHARARQARQAESLGALREAVGPLLAPHLDDPECAGSGDDALDAVVGAMLRRQVVSDK